MRVRMHHENSTPRTKFGRKVGRMVFAGARGGTRTTREAMDESERHAGWVEGFDTSFNTDDPTLEMAFPRGDSTANCAHDDKLRQKAET